MRLKTIKRYASRRHGTVLIAAIAVVVVGLISFFEVFALMPLPWWLYTAFLAVWVLLAFAVVGDHRPTRGIVASALAVCTALAVLYWIPWSSRKPFLRSFEQIRPGMSREQVRTIMGRYELTESKDTLTFQHNSRDDRFNSDFGIVYLRGDLVSATEFLPD